MQAAAAFKRHESVSRKREEVTISGSTNNSKHHLPPMRETRNTKHSLPPQSETRNTHFAAKAKHETQKTVKYR